MSDEQLNDTPDDLAKALEKHPDPDIENQGDIAADDAGATAMAERVTASAGVQGEDADEEI